MARCAKEKDPMNLSKDDRFEMKTLLYLLAFLATASIVAKILIGFLTVK